MIPPDFAYIYKWCGTISGRIASTIWWDGFQETTVWKCKCNSNNFILHLLVRRWEAAEAEAVTDWTGFMQMDSCVAS